MSDEPKKPEHCQFCGGFMAMDEEWGRLRCGKCGELEDDDPSDQFYLTH